MTRPEYVVPEVSGLALLPRHVPILFAQDEAAAATIAALGISVVCCPGGIGHWHPAFAQQLLELEITRVAVITGPSGAALTHAFTVSRGLQQALPEVRMVILTKDLAAYTKEELAIEVRCNPPLPPLPPRHFETLGEQKYRLTVNPEGIVMEVNRLRRSSQELHGELLVRINGSFPQARTFADGILQVGDMNFSSTTTRTSRAKLLADRAGDKDIDWYGLLEDFITKVIAAERTGKPAEVLAEVEDEEEDIDSWTVDGFPLLRQLPQIVFGDAACVAGETRLDGPYGSRTIAELAASRERHVVWALGMTGPVAVLSGVPFLKGIAALYRFEMESGHSVTVTGRHRFLTPSGWKRASALGSGARLVGYAPYQPQTNSERSQPALLGDECHSDQTIADSPGHCSPHRHPDDGQPLQAVVTDRAPSPLLGDAGEHIPPHSHVDVQGIVGAHSLACRLQFPPSNWDENLTPGTKGLLAAWVSATASLHATPHFLSSPILSPCAEATNLDWPSLESMPPEEGEAGDLFSASDLLKTTVYTDTIRRVSYVGIRPFYDVTIPGYANYQAHGLWHHNSGKSMFAMWIAGKLASDGIPVLYADWEFSQAEHKKRLARLFSPMPKLLYYIRCEHSLKQEVDHLLDVVQKLKIQYLICDSIGFAVDGPAESQEGASGYFRYLRQLRVGSLNIAHIPKQYDDNREATVFGSVFFKAGARSVWFIDRSKENPNGELRFGLYHRKNNLGALLQPKGFKLTFRGDRTLLEAINLKDVEELAAGYPLLDRIKELLTEPMTMKAITEELNVTMPMLKATVARHRSQFVRMGNKIGLKVATDPPPETPDDDGGMEF